MSDQKHEEAERPTKAETEAGKKMSLASLMRPPDFQGWGSDDWREFRALAKQTVIQEREISRCAGPPPDSWKPRKSSDASKAIKKSCC